MRIKETVIFFLILPCILQAAQLPSGPSIPSTALTSRLEYSQEIREHFSELTTQKKSIPSSKLEPEKKLEAQVKIQTCFDGFSGWFVFFSFPEEVWVSEEVTEEGFLLEFNQNVDSPDLLKVGEDLAFLIKRLGTGYNTLYFAGEVPISHESWTAGTEFVLHVFPDPAGIAEASRSVKIAEARLFVELRCFHKAFCALTPLLYQYPSNKDVFISWASLEGLLPRWQRSAKILYHLKHLYPCDLDIASLYADIVTPHSSFIKLETDMKRTIDFAIEHYYWLRGQKLLSWTCDRALYFGVIFGLDRAHISSLLNSQGESVGFLGNRWQSTFYLRNEWETGSSATLNFYATEGVVFGAGMDLMRLWPSIQGGFSIAADWHKPYWEIFEAIAGYGREDRLKFRIFSIINRWFNWNFEGGVHRIGIRHVPNGVVSLLANGDFFWNMIVPNPIISFNYNFDAEYVQHLAVRNGVNGPFNPIPLSSREFHTFRFFLTYQWRKYWNVNAFGGLTYNRLGTTSPTAGISVQYMKPCPCGFGFEIGAFRYPSATDVGADVDYLSASVTWYY